VLGRTWAHVRPRELRNRPRLADSPADAWAAATVLVVRRDEFRSVGGFDPRYFLYAEDVDLARRYRAHGLPVRLTDALTAEHEGASSSASEDDTKPAPHAWSILGTLEYVSIWEGEDAAARAARLVLRSLRLQRALLRALPGRRFARKRRQVEAIEAFLVAHARGEGADRSYCPGARVLLRSLG
jgi:GT2 family glycosyltransferase